MGLQTIVRQRFEDGRPGDLYNPANKGLIESFINDAPRAQQVDTVTVATVSDDTDYTVTIDGVDITITSDSTATDQEINDALVAAINAEALVNGRVLAEGTAATTFTLTARYGGTGFTTEVDGTLLTVANTTANAEADPVPFGRLVLKAGLGTNRTRLARLADASALTAKSLDITYGSGTVRVGVKFPGLDVQEASGGSAAALATALDGIDGIDAADAAAVVTVTATTAGADFTIAYINGDADITDQTAGDVVSKKAAGVALSEYDIESQNDGTVTENATTEYLPNSVMSVAREEDVRVSVEDAVTEDSPVYVRLAANGSLDKLGGFRGSYDAGCVLLPNASFIKQIKSGLAAIRVDFN